MFARQPPRPGAWVCGECLAPCPEAWVCRGCGTLLCPKCDAKPHTHPAGDRAGKPCQMGVADDAEMTRREQVAVEYAHKFHTEGGVTVRLPGAA